jgi:two-component system, cell cycle response regulator DivK
MIGSVNANVAAVSMGKRILVVEDQPDNRQIIRDMLAPTNYEITEAENGEDALSGEEKKARAAGCDDYVPKPFSPRQLLAKIRPYLS